jgi:hypothetical protein
MPAHGALHLGERREAMARLVARRRHDAAARVEHAYAAQVEDLGAA